MVDSAPRSHSEALERAKVLLRQGRLNEPNEHFPYKRDVVAALLAENPPFGPDGEDDDRVRVEDFTSEAIVDASDGYVTAQQRYLEEPGDATRAEYQRARDALVAARKAHRANRPAGPVVVGIRARRAGE